MGQILPDSLEHLDLNLSIDPNDLKTFLNNCRHLVGLDKLLVKNCSSNNIDIILNVLKDFVKGNKVKNFAYQVGNSFRFNPDNLEHRALENLANDIQNFVKMKRYSDLVVRISDFDISNQS